MYGLKAFQLGDQRVTYHCSRCGCEWYLSKTNLCYICGTDVTQHPTVASTTQLVLVSKAKHWWQDDEVKWEKVG